MARRGENIYLRKDGRYEGRYPIGTTDTGRTQFGYVYGRRYTDVKRKPTQLKAARKAVRKPKKGCGKQLFSEWAHLYFQGLRNEVCESSRQCYTRILNKHLLPYFGLLRMNQIHSSGIDAFYDSLKSSGRAYSTIENIMRLLHACLRAAVEAGIMTAYSFKKDGKCEKGKSRPRVLTREEQAMLEETEDGGLPYEIGLYTGLRIGEICGLQWKDVDLLSGTIHVRRSVQRLSIFGSISRTTIVVGNVKSGSSDRVLYITQRLKNQLTPV